MDGIRECPHEMVDRVESGEGADRELDGDIEIKLHIHPYGPDHWLKDTGFSFSREGNCDGWVQPMDRDGVTPLPGGPWKSKGYTSSLDAVVSLIERKLPGWCWQAKRGIGCEAIVWQVCKDYDDEGCKTIGFHMSSAPRALLAACLRAILESRPELADANSNQATP